MESKSLNHCFGFDLLRVLLIKNGLEYYEVSATHMIITNSVDVCSVQNPGCTVAVPVAILIEPPEQVMHAVEEIISSAASIDPIQIILWCNATTSTNRQIINKHFQHLIKAAQEFRRFSAIGLRLVLDILPNRFPITAVGQVKKIKQVRTNYMRAIVEEWRLGKIGPDHPVLWFDADTTFVDPITIPTMLQALNDNQAYFIKGNMVYTGHLGDDRTIVSRSPAERVAIIYGAVHSALEDTLGPYDRRDYIDECGLAFKLSTYVAAGGLARSRGPVQGESRVLLGRIQRKLKMDVPIVMYISNARHGTLYRRFQALAQRVSPDKLSEQTGESYFLNSDMTHLDSNAIPIRQSDVLLMVEAMLTNHSAVHDKSLLPLDQIKMISNLVLLAFPKESTTIAALNDKHAFEIPRQAQLVKT